MQRVIDSFKRLRGDTALRHEAAATRARLSRIEQQLQQQSEAIARIEATVRGEPLPTPGSATARLTEDVGSWRNRAQPGELAFHKRPNDRSGTEWVRLNRELWERFDFEPTGYEDKVIVDIGAGSRLRTLYFEGARIMAVEPLADEFRSDVPWNDLDSAERVFATPAEQEIPELVGVGDLVVSINALDHGFDFAAAIRNVRRYLKDDGSAFLSFDQHHTPDEMHPLVLTDPIVREVFADSELLVERFEEKFRYHGGPGPQALNYWLTPA